MSYPAISGYRIERELGRGGMATVYLAEQLHFERKVALKIMERALSADPAFARRFIREGKTVARLSHPNIIKIFDSGEQDGQYYLAMEYLPGGTLRQRIAVGIEIGEALSILRALADALRHAHAHHVVHRDIKSQNVLLYPDGIPVLSDFGIAKALDAGVTATASGLFIGSPRYMSPEQIQGGEIDGRADLYSLGVLFHELLTGQPPYQAEDRMAVLYKHLHDPIPRLPERQQHFQPLLDRLMAKQSEQRYPDAGALIEALDRLDPSCRAPVVAGLDPTVVRPFKPPLPRGGGSPRNRYWSALLGAGVIALAVGTYGLWPRDDRAAVGDVARAEPASSSERAKPSSPVTGTLHRDRLSSGAPGPEMVFIRAGEFLMGSPPEEPERTDDERRHPVVVSDFYLARQPVTVAEFRRFVEATGYRTDAERDSARGCRAWRQGDGAWDWRPALNWRDPGFAQTEQHPVVCLSWSDAQAYVDWLSRETGADYRLPTEAEWEYAARAGTTGPYYWGDDPRQACAYANFNDLSSLRVNRLPWPHFDCDDGHPHTSPVGRFQPNAWGLFDMLGNAWEWTCSAWDSGYEGAQRRCDANGKERVGRGGSWYSFSRFGRSAVRLNASADSRLDSTGLRPARSV